MEIYGGKVHRLIEELSALPGVGQKSAQRMAFHIINLPAERAKQLADAIVDAKENTHYCTSCFTVTDAELDHVRRHLCVPQSRPLV